MDTLTDTILTIDIIVVFLIIAFLFVRWVYNIFKSDEVPVELVDEDEEELSEEFKALLAEYHRLHPKQPTLSVEQKVRLSKLEIREELLSDTCYTLNCGIFITLIVGIFVHPILIACAIIAAVQIPVAYLRGQATAEMKVLRQA